MSKINVTVGGQGQMNVGNLAQGENVSINSGNINQMENASALFAELMKGVRDAGGGDEQVKAVEGKVQDLAAALATEPRNTGRIKEILNVIKQHHDWAFPAISAIVSTIVPAVVALL